MSSFESPTKVSSWASKRPRIVDSTSRDLPLDWGDWHSSDVTCLSENSVIEISVEDYNVKTP
jgi:hypothetical protein